MRQVKQTILGALLVVLALVITSVSALASSNFLSAFNAKYPSSQSGVNGDCQTCHAKSTNNLNAFGRDVKNAAGGSVTSRNLVAALTAVEGLNSDGNAGGHSNLAEITANTQPGWTTGLQTVYDRGTLAPVATKESADPLLVFGDLDPAGSPPPALPTVTIAATTPNASEVGPTNGQFTVTRTGATTSALAVNYAISGTATNGTDYSTLSGSVTIAAASATATISVTPLVDALTEGTETVILTLSANAAYTVGSPNSATVNIADNPPTPNIVVTPLSVNFGNVTEKTNSDRKVNIANNGSAALTVSAALDATTSLDFSIVTGPPATIGVGLSADVTVRYTPNAVGSDAGALVINSNDPDMPQVKVPLSGSGVAAPVLACLINVGPASLDFGTLNLGGSATKQVTVSNNGTADCNVMATLSGSVDFSASPLGSFTVAPTKSQTVNVTYMASDAGADAGTLDVASNDPSKPNVAVGLKGAGPAAQNIVVLPLSVDFGNVTEKTNSDRKVNIANTGQLTLKVSAALDGTSPDFSIVTGPPATIGAGLSADVTVRYTPNAVGADADALVINSDDPDMPQITVPLKGSGVAAPVLACLINVGPASLDFGTLSLGGSSTKQVTISNNGTANCNVTAALDPTTSPDFAASPLGGLSASPSGSFTVAPTKSQTVGISYTASDAGSDAGALDIASNDPNKPNVTVGLKGSGRESAVVREQFIDEAKWQAKTSKLVVKGKLGMRRHPNRNGEMVTISDAITGDSLGTVPADARGRWQLEINPTSVPCWVVAEADGSRATKRVQGASKSCADLGESRGDRPNR